MTLKLIAFAALLEFALVRPLIMGDGSAQDFIGFVLVHSILAFFGKINIKDLDVEKRKNAFMMGAVGGVIGYAYLLLFLPWQRRHIHHLFFANALILVGVLFGAWRERKRRRGPRAYTDGVRPSESTWNGWTHTPVPGLGFNAMGGGGCCGK